MRGGTTRAVGLQPEHVLCMLVLLSTINSVRNSILNVVLWKREDTAFV